MGEQIDLIPTVGIFITMNPGYAGRTELPENLKALFRPCAMVVPDFELICEIMLVAEGFQDARVLARKFITLYTLCKELLSKQDHYDWGLRAIKSVLVVAGSLKVRKIPVFSRKFVIFNFFLSVVTLGAPKKRFLCELFVISTFPKSSQTTCPSSWVSSVISFQR